MASPTFSTTANSPNNVKFEVTSSTATPRASIAIPTTANQSGQTTPRRLNGNENGFSTNSLVKEQEEHISLYDPTHLPSLFGRIQRISKYLISASADANSLSHNDQSQQQQQQLISINDENTTANNNVPSISLNNSISIPAPNIALGATTDDDVNSGYETALSMSFGGGAGAEQQQQQVNLQPTQLAKSIVRESVDLRKAFQRAQKAIERFDGGDMDLEEQQHLIGLLEEYSEEQQQIRHSFIDRANIFDTQDSEMVDV